MEAGLWSTVQNNNNHPAICIFFQLEKGIYIQKAVMLVSNTKGVCVGGCPFILPDEEDLSNLQRLKQQNLIQKEHGAFSILDFHCKKNRKHSFLHKLMKQQKHIKPVEPSNSSQ